MTEKTHTILTGFPPVEDSRITALVLGSFPSVVSMEESFYYAHPRNQFWPILARCWNEQAPAEIPARKNWVLSRRLGIWDMFASCERNGSLDQALKHGTLNDLEAFLRTHAKLERILLNGSLAASAFRKASRTWTVPIEHLRVYTLPSTSPVPSQNYRRMEDKIAAWKEALGQQIVT